MDNFSGVKNVIALFKEVKTYPHCRFVLASSAVSLMKKVNEKLAFIVEAVTPLDKEAVKKIVGGNCKEVYHYSVGYALYVDVLMTGLLINRHRRRC